LIRGGYFGNTVLAPRPSAFNFYVHNGQGDYEEVCDHWTLPSGFSSDCPFADNNVIVHLDNERDCASGNTFSTEFDGNRTVVHESGHAVFGMKDEYCCDGGYSELGRLPNIFESQANCQAYATSIGSAPANCFEFCPTTKCWPGTAAAQASCTAYYTARGWDTAGCSCTDWATANGQDTAGCTAINGNDCNQYWKSYWNGRTVATADLTVSSPNWCNYRGSRIESCCDGGWWKLDFDPYNPVNTGNCVMKSGTVWGETCEIRVLDKLRGL